MKKFSFNMIKIFIKNIFLQLLIYLNLYFIIERLFFKNLKQISFNANRNVICLGRSIFNDDVFELAKNTTELNFYIVDKSFFINFFYIFLSKMPKHQNHIHYHKYENFFDQKMKYYKFLEKLFINNKKIKFDLFLSANYNYAWQQELAKMCNNNKIPFIVLLKEFISPKKDILTNIERYTNNNFIGYKMLVYNNNIRNAFLEKKLHGINKNNIISTGVPRFDRYKYIKPIRNKIIKNILFFSFDIEDKSRHLDICKKDMNKLNNETKNFHLEIIKFAKNNPSYDICIKTKSNVRYISKIRKYIKDLNATKLNNLKLSNNESVFKLIQKAEIIICFNSITMFESILAKRYLLLPDIGNGLVKNLFDGFNCPGNFIKNGKDIHSFINNVNEDNFNFQIDNKDFLYNFIHHDNYKSSKHVNKQLIDAIFKY